MGQQRTRQQKQIASFKRTDPASSPTILYSFTASKSAKFSKSRNTASLSFSQKDNLRDLRKTFFVSLIILTLLIIIWMKLR